MKPPRDPHEDFSGFTAEEMESSAKTISAEEILEDLRAGLRTRGFLTKYGLTLGQFEGLLKGLIRKGLLTKDEFKVWKAHRVAQTASEPEAAGQGVAPSPVPERLHHNVKTFVITEPEMNNSWALQLFSTQRERMKGAQFKVNLHGKKYAFIVEQMLFRGQVEMLATADSGQANDKSKREQALEFISRHGWAAYLESRAVEANLGEPGPQPRKKARLVLLHCRNHTFLAALHTPAPAINLYVGSSLEKIRGRLAKSVDTSLLDF
ncbi:MAG: hypothetical protein HY913_10700 [Desulfomonile tiedjei]|nr:hypothetical protein [Desulfomonile tiedjei]